MIVRVRMMVLFVDDSFAPIAYIDVIPKRVRGILSNNITSNALWTYNRPQNAMNDMAEKVLDFISLSKVRKRPIKNPIQKYL